MDDILVTNLMVALLERQMEQNKLLCEAIKTMALSGLQYVQDAEDGQGPDPAKPRAESVSATIEPVQAEVLKHYR